MAKGNWPAFSIRWQPRPTRESGGERQQPTRAAAAAGIGDEDMVAFRRFQSFLCMEQGPNPSPRRRRGGEEDDEDEGYGPSPIVAATAKAKGEARGPLLLKSLSGRYFETFKHLAKDVATLTDGNNALLRR